MTPTGNPARDLDAHGRRRGQREGSGATGCRNSRSAVGQDDRGDGGGYTRDEDRARVRVIQGAADRQGGSARVQPGDGARLSDGQAAHSASLGGSVAGAARCPERIGDAATDNEYHYRECHGNETSLLELQFHFLSLI